MPIPKWFYDWKENDYQHLKKDVGDIKSRLARVEGIVYVLVLLSMAILALIKFG